jgi:hypothetical protein
MHQRSGKRRFVSYFIDSRALDGFGGDLISAGEIIGFLARFNWHKGKPDYVYLATISNTRKAKVSYVYQKNGR